LIEYLQSKYILIEIYEKRAADSINPPLPAALAVSGGNFKPC